MGVVVVGYGHCGDNLSQVLLEQVSVEMSGSKDVHRQKRGPVVDIRIRASTIGQPASPALATRRELFYILSMLSCAPSAGKDAYVG